MSDFEKGKYFVDAHVNEKISRQETIQFERILKVELLGYRIVVVGEVSGFCMQANANFKRY